VVGIAAYATDVVVFTALLTARADPLLAKVTSAVFAITVAYTGSRRFTWPTADGSRPAMTLASFVAVSVVAALVQLGWLTSIVADNVSANVIGMALATAVRFWGFRRMVFAPAACGKVNSG